MGLIFSKNFMRLSSSIICITFLRAIGQDLAVQIYTKHGVFWKLRLKQPTIILNFRPNLLEQNQHTRTRTLKTLTSQFLVLVYNAWIASRYYVKIKGLGYSLRYIKWPHHFLMLFLGFSVPLYLRLALTIHFIKNPKKKKAVFLIKSSNHPGLLNFLVFLKKLKQPDPYKLKGIRNVGEYFDVKEGKKKK